MNAACAISRFVSPVAASSATRSSVAVSSSGARRLGLTTSSSPRARSAQIGAPSRSKISSASRNAAAAARRCFGATIQTPLRQPGAAKLERKTRCRLEVKRVERHERAGQVAHPSGHDRPRAGQRRIDPDPRKRPSSLLEPSECFPRTVDFTKRHQQFDVERLGAIEEPVLDTDLIEQPAHLRQRPIGCLMITGGVLTKPARQQDRRPPRLLGSGGRLDKRPQRGSGAIEPAPMSVDHRSPGKRVGEPAAHFQPPLDRVAAALDQLLGERAPAGLELD